MTLIAIPDKFTGDVRILDTIDVGDDLDVLLNYFSATTNGVQELVSRSVPEKYMKIVDNVCVEMTNNEKIVKDQMINGTLSVATSAAVTPKPVLVSLLQNEYINFVTSYWSKVLRNYKLIQMSQTITQCNTPYVTNLKYLYLLKNLDKNEFMFCFQMFVFYKNTLKEFGYELHESVYNPNVTIKNL